MMKHRRSRGREESNGGADTHTATFATAKHTQEYLLEERQNRIIWTLRGMTWLYRSYIRLILSSASLNLNF